MPVPDAVAPGHARLRRPRRELGQRREVARDGRQVVDLLVARSRSPTVLCVCTGMLSACTWTVSSRPPTLIVRAMVNSCPTTSCSVCLSGLNPESSAVSSYGPRGQVGHEVLAARARHRRLGHVGRRVACGDRDPRQSAALFVLESSPQGSQSGLRHDRRCDRRRHHQDDDRESRSLACRHDYPLQDRCGHRNGGGVPHCAASAVTNDDEINHSVQLCPVISVVFTKRLILWTRILHIHRLASYLCQMRRCLRCGSRLTNT